MPDILWFALAFLGIPMLGGLLAWCIHCWFTQRKLEVETALKQDMVQRGMSAEEIARVLGGPVDEPSEEAKIREHQLTVEMVQRGMPADEIVRVLAATKHPPPRPEPERGPSNTNIRPV